MNQYLTLLKDILYLIGSILGIIGFIRTVRKRGRCEFNYKTEFGDEVHPFLICIRGDIYNLEISSKEISIEGKKLPINTNLSRFKYKELDPRIIDESSFFPIIKEAEVLCIANKDLNLPVVYLKFEDKYHNKYMQLFSFDKSDVENEDRLKRQSRSCYHLSKRRFRFLGLWWPLMS